MWPRQAVALLFASVASFGSGDVPPPDYRVDFSEHGGDWEQFQCKSRLYQSPIDLDALYKPVDGFFTYFYNDVHSQNITFKNDGRSLYTEVIGEGFGGVNLDLADGNWYNLKRIDIKAASDHTLRGQHTPIEVQLTHQQSNIKNPTHGPQLVTVSILINSKMPPQPKKEVWPGFLQRSSGKLVKPERRGASLLALNRHSRAKASDSSISTAPAPAPAPAIFEYEAPSRADLDFNPTLQFFVQQEPPVFAESIGVPILQSNPLQLGQWVAGGTYFMYRGSETLPPCAENVVWLVRREVVWASHAQVNALWNAIYKMSDGAGNYRTVMPLNERDVKIWSASEKEPSFRPVTAMPPVGPPTGLDDERDSKFIPMAQDAITIAKAASDYARDIDLRYSRASNAYVNSLKVSSVSTPPPATVKPVYVPKPPLDIPWAASQIGKVIQKSIQDVVRQELKEVGPAAGNLARSYMRQRILSKAGWTLPPPVFSSTTPYPTTSPPFWATTTPYIPPMPRTILPPLR